MKIEVQHTVGTYAEGVTFPVYNRTVHDQAGFYCNTCSQSSGKLRNSIKQCGHFTMEHLKICRTCKFFVGLKFGLI